MASSAWLVSAVLVALVAVVMLTATVDTLARRQGEATASVVQAREVLEAAARIEADLAVANSEARISGSLLSEQSGTRFAAAVRRSQESLEALRLLTAGEPAQREAVARLEPLLAARVAALRQVMAPGEADEATRAARNLGARALSDQVLAQLDVVRSEQARLLETRSDADRDAVRRVLYGLATSGGAIALSVLAILAVLAARRRERRHLEQLAAINTELEARVADRTRDLARSEGQLREREARFRHLAEQANDAVLRVGRDGLAGYVSPAAGRIMHLPAEALVGTGLFGRIHPDDAPALQAAHARLLAAEVREERLIFRALRGDGAEVWFEGTAHPMEDPATGAPDGYLAVCRDVTEQRRLELERDAHADSLHRSNRELERLARHLARERDRVEQASRAKSLFLAGMSHELRTPLNGILGHAQLLGHEGALSPEQSGRVAAMLAAGQHLLGMINHVLTLSQIEMERIELDVSEVELRSFVQACLEVVRPAAEAKGLALDVARSPDLAPTFRADAVRLRQIVLNLLGNAVKYTEAGSVELRLRAAQDGAMLRIEVADTGPGIPEPRRRELFQAFQRLEADPGQHEGTGLGLAISHRLVALMGGRIGHDPNPGGGSVFWMELPLLAGKAAAPAARPDASAAAPGRPLRILVVDDVAMNRDIAEAFLKVAGHEPACADGGAAAVAAATSGGFDAILMDIRMPGMDGCAATRAIRALPGPPGEVPILALTAQSFADQVEACRAAGMDGHLAKPFTLEGLVAALAEAIAAAKVRPAATPAPSPAPSQSPGPPPDPMPAEPACGEELPVLDAGVFERTASFLPPESVASYLQVISTRAGALAGALRGCDGQAERLRALGAEAHVLAGSAGLFGFRRLAATARLFEHATEGAAQELRGLAADLLAASELSLEEARRAAAALAAA